MDDDCTDGTICYQGICVGEGSLRFSMSWTVDTDFDLHVITPSGVEISWQAKTAGGGMLDVDDCIASNCRVSGGPHVENIYFPVGPEHGTYTYWVHNYQHVATGDYELQVASAGVVQATQTGTVSPEITESPRYTFTY
jgi:uncharacterized protein YfaP (DUF2135 family)